MKSARLRPDYRAILQWIRTGSSVLDLGCGDGELLELLVRERGIRARGIEINEQAIYRCVARGLSVVHEDIEDGLAGYRDRSFDFVILYQSLQQVRKIDPVLREALRVGGRVIVGFPNFAHIGVRWQIAFRGRTPVTDALPYAWHDTPNLHFLSIQDFIAYCRERAIRINDKAMISGNRRVAMLPNLLAGTGIFLISNQGDSHGCP